MSNTYTAELQLVKPTPADPLSQNSWGTLLNTTFDLIDSAVAGELSLSVAGSSNVTLTSAQGSTDQERNQHFIFTGALTGNVVVLYPAGRTKMFSVLNSTSGAFTLSIGVSNGSGSAAGTTVAIAQGLSDELVSDGTNIARRLTAGTQPSGSAGGDLSGTYPNPTVSQLNGNPITFYIPTGIVLPYVGSSQPSGWLLCSGQAVSRTTYATLFALVGTTFGSGDGSTTFNVPDLRGRVVAGVGNMGGSESGRLNGVIATGLGNAGGDQNLQSHSHGLSDPSHSHGVNDPSHSHLVGNIVSPSAGGAGINTLQGNQRNADWITTEAVTTGISIQSAFTGISISASGSGNSQNVQPTMQLNYIIKY